MHCHTQQITIFQTLLNQDSNPYSRIIGIFKMNVTCLILPLFMIGFCFSAILKRFQTETVTGYVEVRV